MSFLKTHSGCLRRLEERGRGGSQELSVPVAVTLESHLVSL